MAAHGRYTIVGKLADGGMAEIFLGTQHGAEGFEKPVVLKRIHTALGADAQFRNMFIDEAHISMSLSHGNIVQVLDLGVANGRYFLVLELVDGWDLDRVLKRARAASIAWPPALSLYVAATVCRALSFAHAKSQHGRALGIVHRDVSPNNVLLSEQGEVKLADFGIAKAQRKREQTAAGVIKGKVAFMSPEQATGAVIDRRSDLFSVGSMLYLMATDRPPFEAGTDLESLARVQRAEFAPPESVRPTLGPAITRIIARAMRLGPGERYQTADEMLADIERVLRTEYHSAGQTELKLWLAQLARRDGHPPISKMAVAGGTASDGGGTDLNAGTSFELDDLELASISMTEVATTPPPMSVSGTPSPGRKTPQLTPGPTMVEGGGKSPPPSAATAPVKHRRFGGFWMGVAVAFAAVIGLRYLGEWASHQHWFATPTTAGDSAVPIVPAPAASPPTAEPTASPAPATLPSTPTTVDAALAGPAPIKESPPAAPVDARAAVAVATAPEPVVAPDAGGGPKAADDDDDDNSDEETLLRKADPRATESVIGEDEAAPSAKTVAQKAAAAKAAAAKATTTSASTEKKSAATPESNSARKPGSSPPSPPGKTPPSTGKAAPAASTTPPKPAAPYVTVSMHITSTPVGAVVRINKRVLGRTPINLRFKTGNDYQLTFVKNGYVTVTKSVAVRGTHDGKFGASMKKQPAASSRSFFHPHR